MLSHSSPLSAPAGGSGQGFQELREEDRQFIEANLPYFSWYAITLPILSALAVLGNLICFFVFHHPDMRCLSTMFLNVVLLSDIAYLVCINLVFPMRLWTYVSYSNDEEEYLSHLETLQSVFINVYPISEMVQCLVVWYTMCVVLEQYFAFYHPVRLWSYSNRDKGIKIITTIFIPTIVIHMVHFFKFVRHELHQGKGVPVHVKICLSDMYISKHFQFYEKFVYYLGFRAIPWLVIIYCLIRIVIALIRHKRLSGNSIPDLKLARVLKGGRSTPLVIIIAVSFIILDGSSLAMYVMALDGMEFDQFTAGCRFIPTSRRFDSTPPRIELVYSMCLMLFSSLKFPMCYLAGVDFREIIVACLCWPGRKAAQLKRVSIFHISRLGLECRTFSVSDWLQRSRALRTREIEC